MEETEDRSTSWKVLTRDKEDLNRRRCQHSEIVVFMYFVCISFIMTIRLAPRKWLRIIAFLATYFWPTCGFKNATIKI